MARFFAAFLTLLLLAIGTASAAESPADASTFPVEDDMGAPAEEAGTETVGEKAQAEGEQGEKGPNFIDTAHAAISGSVLDTANWLDSFFTDPRLEREISKTRFKVRFSYLLQDEESPEYEMKAKFRLDLPLLEERLHLLIDGDPEDEDDEDDLENFAGEVGEQGRVTPDDDDFSAALRYFLKQTLYQNISVRSGIRWRDGVPVLFVEPRYRQTFPMDPWQLRFTQRVFGFSDGRTGVRTTFDYERELRKPFFFRATADGSWESDEKGYFYNFVFSLYQRFSSRRVLIYNWGNNFSTEPEHQLDSVVFSARYRQRIYRDWMFYEILPQVAFPEDRDYAATPALLLRLEMLFGYYPKLPPPSE